MVTGLERSLSHAQTLKGGQTRVCVCVEARIMSPTLIYILIQSVSVMLEYLHFCGCIVSLFVIHHKFLADKNLIITVPFLSTLESPKSEKSCSLSSYKMLVIYYYLLINSKAGTKALTSQDSANVFTCFSPLSANRLFYIPADCFPKYTTSFLDWFPTLRAAVGFHSFQYENQLGETWDLLEICNPSQWEMCCPHFFGNVSSLS